MKSESYAVIVDVVKKASGISLGPDKKYLVESRLTPLLKTRGMTGLDELAMAVAEGRDAALVGLVVEAMTTNETSFFRDPRPFTALLEKVMPEIVAELRSPRISVWSAACSTGQEAYSLAIAEAEKPELFGGRRLDIVGTDISADVISRARSASFNQFEVQRGLTIQQLVKWFEKCQDGSWKLKEEIARRARFQVGNLLSGPPPGRDFDLVLCRNVLIYFDEATRRVVLERIRGVLKPGGFLMLGGAEALPQGFDGMRSYQGLYGFYRKV